MSSGSAVWGCPARLLSYTRLEGDCINLRRVSARHGLPSPPRSFLPLPGATRLSIKLSGFTLHPFSALVQPSILSIGEADVQAVHMGLCPRACLFVVSSTSSECERAGRNSQ